MARTTLAVMVTVGVVASQPATATTVPWDGGGTITLAADGAQWVVGADVDGDGDVDALSASPNDDTIAWHENLGGDGSSWTTTVISSIADEAQSVIAADVDGDGDVDAISASLDDDTVAWFENKFGDGSGWTRITISTSADGAKSVAAGDVDGDGDLDVISASQNAGTVAWYENLAGDGSSWTPHDITTTVPGVRSVRAGDVDGDGDLDVLWAKDNRVAWHENTAGDGSSWTAHTISFPAPGGESVYVADLDGDGDLDALAERASVGVEWHENTAGDGSSWTTHLIDSRTTPFPVAAADLDGDGDLDVISGSFLGSIAWWENTAGDGSAWSEHGLATGGNPQSVFPTDVDGDGDLDVLYASSSDDTIGWRRNVTIHRSAVFPSATVISSLADGARMVLTADLDGDGDPDALSASSTADTIAWYANADGAGSFTAPMSLSTTADGARSVATGDLDGDGDLDVLSASFDDDTVAWYENTVGDGSIWTATAITTTADGAMTAQPADLDGDGDLDVVAASRNDDTVAWYKNTGSGVFAGPLVISTVADGARSVVAADLDDDGDLDVVAASSEDDTIAWYENDGAGAFSGPLGISTVVGVTPQSVSAADLDRDGDLDVLSAARVGERFAWHENSDGQGLAWLTHEIPVLGSEPRSIHAVDMDGDGDVDLVTTSFSDHRVSWIENQDGEGSLWIQHTLTTAAAGAEWAHAADVDQDGDADVLSASFFDDAIAWYENRGGQFALATLDVAQKVVAPGQVEDLLAVEVLHRGRLGDGDLALNTLELQLTDGGRPEVPLTPTQAETLFQELRVYLEVGGQGGGTFDPTDILTDSLSSFAGLTAEGVVSVSGVAGGGRVAFGAPLTYYVVAEMALTAGSMRGARAFEVIHRTATSSTAIDADHSTVPLTLEWADNVSSGRVETVLSSSSCQAPFDLNLTERTVEEILVCTAGTVIQAGPAFTVAQSGDLTLQAGTGIELSDGFSVEVGGSFAAETDPALEP